MAHTLATTSSRLLLMRDSGAMPSALAVIHGLTPLIVLLPTLTLLPPSPPPIQLPTGLRPITTKHVSPRRSLILYLISAISLTYLLDGALFVVTTVMGGEWDVDGPGSGGAWTLYTLGSVFIWSGMAMLTIWRAAYDRKGLVVASTFGFILEIVVLVLQVLYYVHNDSQSAISTRLPSLLHTLLPPLRLLLLPILLWALSTPTITFLPASPTLIASATPSSAGPSTETDGLLGPPETAGLNSAKGPYGTFGSDSGSAAASGTALSENRPKLPPSKGSKEGTAPKPPSEISWSEWFSRFIKLVPFLWPSKSRYLQLLASLCLCLLVVGRFVNVAVPQTLGKVVQCLGSYQTGEEGKCQGGTVWPSVFVFVALRFCQGGGGVLSVAQQMLWAPVMQYSDREMSMNSFNHLLDLSLAFHTRRKTGEVLRILDRGSAINNIFQLLLMNVSPILFDIGIACVYFYAQYGWSLAMVVSFVMISYIAVSVTLTTWRTKLRRQMVERDVVTRGIHTDVLMNWESVKYFTAENRESTRYQAAINAYQSTEIKVIGSLNLLNLAQNFIITSGLLAGSLIVAWRVTQGTSDAAQFVVFLTYLGQLYAPLNSLGMIYRQLNGGLVDAEKLLKLLEEEKEILDKPGAKDLVITEGKIEFKNVSFSYDGKVSALKDISFTIEHGSSVALVGESGSGKSSILRLLYRFYDISSGTIEIDGQNIQDVTQKSLRQAIGIVPQDAVLWNDTLRQNIGYGKEGASDEEIIAAAKAASLHDRIMSFPLGYETFVGERGVRLSGGERQRVSLARTILKHPAILVLDEATSALDTETEREVQKSLEDLAKGRSSLMIAHRLSTIVKATKIIVLKSGSVIESGSHRELIKKPNGVFAAMWKEQIRTNTDGTHSPVLEKGPADVTIPDVGYSLDATKPTAETETAEPFAMSSAPPTVATTETAAILDVPMVEEPEEETSPLLPVDEAVEAPPSLLKVPDVSPAKDSQAEGSESRRTSMSPSPMSTPAASPPKIGFPTSRPSVSHSLSESSQTFSDGGSPSPADAEGKKDKRKRLSSIKGLVRRGSDKLKQEFGGGPSSSTASPQAEAGSPLATPNVAKRLSFKGKPKD